MASHISFTTASRPRAHFCGGIDGLQDAAALIHRGDAQVGAAQIDADSELRHKLLLC